MTVSYLQERVSQSSHLPFACVDILTPEDQTLAHILETLLRNVPLNVSAWGNETT